MEEDTIKLQVLAIDLAKDVFQVAGEDGCGKVVVEQRLRSRETFWRFVEALPAGLEVLMETGPGAQAWGRAMQARGLCVRLLPAQRVAEHRNGAKNDRKDARALLRAGHDDAIHAVPVKSVAHLTMQALHRVRSGYQRRRTAVSNQIRGFLLEHGIAVGRGDLALERKLAKVWHDGTIPVPDRLRDLLAELWAEHQALGRRLQDLNVELEAGAANDPLARRLMTVPGIGPITASALVCKDLRTERFANARQFAAYFGLVPDQHSTGRTIRLGRMSRRGDTYVRSLAIEGAHAVLQRVDAATPASARLWRWKQRHGSKGAAVRLANRNLRIVWSLLRHDRDYVLSGSR